VLLAGTSGFAQVHPQGPPQLDPTRNLGAYLGVDIRTVTPDRAGILKLVEVRGAEITMVDQDGPAAKSGLKEHDVILSFSNRKFDNADQLRSLIHDTPPGQAVTLGISRNGQSMYVGVRLANRRQMLTPPPRMQVPGMELPQLIMAPLWSRNGLMVEDLTPQLSEFFGVPNGEGVLVRSVEAGSPAAAAGFKAGDVIVKVNGQPVSCGADWHHALQALSAGAVTFNIIRERRPRVLSMKLPSPRGALRTDFLGLNAELRNLGDELDRLEPQWERSFELAQVQAAHDLARIRTFAQRELEQAFEP
jgi:predicted metalloprotease with PDZ domain